MQHNNENGANAGAFLGVDFDCLHVFEKFDESSEKFSLFQCNNVVLVL